MRAMFSVFLLTVGIALLILGLNAADSVSSSISRVFRGVPSDRATWLIVAGAAATVMGIAGAAFPRRSRPHD